MGAISLRLPESIHKKVKELANQDGTSINQFITSALAEKMSALLTEEYLKKRAAQGSRQKFEQALSKVSDQEPQEYDKL
jgi:hypothetical protein